jgi:hypothetical protein
MWAMDLYKHISFLIGFLLTCLAASSFGQTKISGIVKDVKEEPVPGANIVIKNSYDGTSSSSDGSFSFTTSEKGERVLVVTFIGYKTFELVIQIDKTEISIAVVLKEEINQLEGVVVSAGSFTAGEEKRRTILKPVDIATTAGATADIAGALNTLPGTTKVGESGRLFVRGGDSNEARTFIDGMVVLDAYGPAAPNTPSRGRFLPFMFKGTSFSTGGYSAEYGQALSSALVLNSKDGVEMNQTDIGILSVGADVAHTQVWDKASVSGKIQYTDLRPYFGMINQEIDWHSPPVSFEGHAVYRQRVGKDGMLKFYSNYNHSELSMYNHEILNPQSKHLFELDNTYQYNNLSYRQSLNTKWSIRGGTSLTMNKNQIMLDGQPLTESENGIHAKMVLENSVSDKVELRFGTELIDRTYKLFRADELAGTETISFDEPIGAAFIEAELYANNQFVVKVGGRTEYNGMINAWSVDPRASMAYKPWKKGQFSFAYGTFRQSSQNQYLRINQSLGAEKAEHFILNYQVINNDRTFRIETYYKKYDNLIKFDDYNSQVLTNSGKGYAKGLEFFWRDSQTIKNVDYWVSYSLLDTKRDYLGFPGLATPAFASTHNFSFVYKHFVKAIKSQVGFTYSYASGRPYYNPNKNSNEFHSDRTPYYQDISLNIAYLPKPNLIVYFSTTNLLGRDNIFGYEYSTGVDGSGKFVNRAIRQPAPRFLFIAVFITLSKNKSVNQLPNL